MKPSTQPEYAQPRFPRFLLIVTVVLMAAIGATGWLYLKQQQTRLRQTIEQQLAAIADLKVQQIVNWRNERLGDARFFAKAAFVARDVQAFLADPASEPAKAAILDWLTLLKGDSRYTRLTLLDAQFKVRLTIPPDRLYEPDPVTHALAATLQSHDVAMTDLHRDNTSGDLHLGILSPLFPPPAPAIAPVAPIGFILLQLDPYQFLYPLIQRWPTPSRTAETLLVRREGNEVVFLNKLRHRPNTALTLRFPLASRPDTPAVLAVQGQEGVVEGQDYRDISVLAALRPIPKSPWFLVAKVDQEEIYAPLRRQAAITGIIAAMLILVTGLGVGLIWRQRDTLWLRQRLAVEQERQLLAERVEHLLKDANDIILLLDQDGRILEANDRALESYGYSLDDLQRLDILDLREPETRAEFAQQFDQALQEKQTVFETVHRRQDGSAFPVEVSSRAVSIGAATYLLSIIRDISQRKAHEQEIERLTRLYAALSQINQAVVRATTRQELLDQICRALIEFGRFKMAWIGWCDPQTPAVIPVAQYGDSLGYLNDIEVFADDRPLGHGPTGTAIRAERPYICNDFFNDPKTLPWREAATKHSFRASAALPIRLGGKVCGALSLYAPEPGFFGEKEIALLEEAALDISFGLDHLEAETQRRQAEDERDRLFNLSLDLLCIAGFDGYLKQINPAWMKTLGWTTEELLSRPWRDFIHADDLDTIIQTDEDLRRGWPVRGIELRYRCKDDSYRWLSWNVYPLLEAQQAFCVARDVTEQKAAEARIQYLAYYDALTELPNRTLLRDRAAQALANAHRDNTEVALLFLDLDHFKTVNDSLGHSVGDQLLRAVATRLKNAVRDTDTVSRLGGDEFLILLVESNAQGAARVAQKILDLFECPFEMDSRIFHVGTSIGISLYPQDAHDFESLFRYADAALYQAKEGGRKTFHFFQPAMNTAAFERLTLESALRQALAQGEFELYYQPQIAFDSSRLVGFEALLRWRHAELGLVAPAKFIPVAESSGLIVDIGAWVLREACRQNRAWRDAGLFQVPVAVNLSAVQIRHGNLAASIQAILTATGLPASSLELEVTESLLVDDSEFTLNQFHQLKDIGIRLAVDDFGTGYSSLSYLKRFPIDKLKIDQSFVRDIVTDPDDLSIAYAVVSIGHSLRLKVIAEGVESEDAMRILRDMACDEAQGYLFAQPMPAAAIPGWFAEYIQSIAAA